MEGDSINKRQVGSESEKIASNFLEKNGLNIICNNFYCKFGEIDIIASDNDYLVFVEVKYRRTASAGYPEEAVNYNKIRKICKTADFYLMLNSNKLSFKSYRFDVIAIEGNDIRWHKNAFEYLH